MALTFIKRNEVPVSAKGKPATKPVVSISDKGQLTLNTLATKFLEGNLEVAIGFDAGKLYIVRGSSKIMAKIPQEARYTMRKGKQGESVAMAASSLFKSSKHFGDHVYDYALSGNQSFDAVLDEKNGAIVFDLPKGALARRPTVARTRKASKPVVGGTRAEAGSTVAVTKTAPAETEELQLEDAMTA